MKKGVIGLLVMTCVLAGCKEDVYNPNYNPNLGTNVPENFDWSTTKTLTVNVDVNDEYDGKYYYAVRVYDKTPGEGILPVAASGKVNKDLPFSQEIVVPATVSKLYIVQAFKKADASEVITKKEVAISGESVACSFGNSSSTTTRSANTRGKNEIVVGDNQTVTITSITEKDSPHYIVENGGTLHFEVSGTLSGWEITINHGGKMTAANGTELTMESNSRLYNYGSVDIYDINFIKGATLHNGDAMEGQNEGGCFTARNITMVNGHGGDKRYLGERSYLSCEKLILNNVKLTFKTGAWLNCDKLVSTGEGADTLQGEGETVTDSRYVGLATIKEIEIKSKLEIISNILVQCGKKQGNIKGETVEDASGMITITGTACSGGFGTEEKNELGTYTYIIEDMYPAEGDYDMNDIVISLTAIQEESKLTIDGQLKAVGATYKIVPYIKVGNETKPLYSDQGNALEAHLVLGDETGSSIINTDKGYAHRSGENFNLEFDPVNEGLNMDDIDFYIEVNGTTVHWNTYKDGNTWGMRIPGADFRWPQEKVNITEAYPDFTEWFKDKSYPWYNNPNPNLIY